MIASFFFGFASSLFQNVNELCLAVSKSTNIFRSLSKTVAKFILRLSEDSEMKMSEAFPNLKMKIIFEASFYKILFVSFNLIQNNY